MVKAYLHKNWADSGDRIVVHPRGAPQGLADAELSVTENEQALTAARRYYGSERAETRWDQVHNARAIRPMKIHNNTVIHLHPGTFELIEAFPLI